MDFQLSQEILLPVEIITESEAYFLRYVVPVILILPWIVYFLVLLLKWVSKFFQGNNSEFAYKQNLGWMGDPILPPERVMSLREMEKLAETDPREALLELSRFLRVKYLKPKYRPYSLEYHIKEKEDALFVGRMKWLNLFLESVRSRFTNRYSLIFSEIVELVYSSKPVLSVEVLGILKRVRDKEWDR